LARLVEEGAPVDVFAAADTEHVDALAGKISDQSVYARGQLAVWAPGGGVKTVRDLADAKIKFVAIAQPELAPYGKAAVEALQASGVWEALQPKLVYAGSVSQAKQLAATGNADAAFTSYSLVFREPGAVLLVEGKQIKQALGVVAASPRVEDARKFVAFVLGLKGRAVLTENGYLTEPSNPRRSRYPSP
jgi:molybdate transport system substrate-binding protein